jgi:hypothetical protein
VSGYEYPGGELTLFQHARRWKAYLRTQISPWLRGTTIEVGAGLGGTTHELFDPKVERWICLEPDLSLFGALVERLATIPGADSRVRAQAATLSTLDPAIRADVVLYVDVLEHIDDDRRELADAVARLAPGGHRVVLAPAHQWLYSEFDRSIGHYRRYSARSLRALTPAGAVLERVRYLDAAGICASLANRVLLGQQLPTLSQVMTWDRWIVPVSRVIDPLTGFSLGKSVLAVWRRRAP